MDQVLSDEEQAFLSRLTFDDDGLIPVVVQSRTSGEVRMVAYANAEALSATLASGQAHFWSRSRRRLWRKGETSGHSLRVLAVWADCDRDALVYRVRADGPTCHTGRPTCFFRRLSLDGDADDGAADRVGAGPGILDRVIPVIRQRLRERPQGSYSGQWAQAPREQLAKKLTEETLELILARDEEASAHEAADLLFHLLLWVERWGPGSDAVWDQLRRRRAAEG